MANIDVESMNCKRHISQHLKVNEKGMKDEIICENKDLKPNCEIDCLQDLVAELHRVFSSDYVNVEYVSQLMMNYKSNPADWKKYAKFDRFRYTRNLVDAGNGAFNIMVLCWGGGHASAIHDHADSHCFMKILAGELEEVRYSWPEGTNPVDKNQKIMRCVCKKINSDKLDAKLTSCTLVDVDTSSSSSYGDSSEDDDCCCIRPRIDRTDEDQLDDEVDVCAMVETGRTKIELDDVCYINDTLGLHRVENPSHVNGAVSLHLYCPPFDACKVFDARTGKSSNAQVTFWSMYGSRRNKEIQENRAAENN